MRRTFGLLIEHLDPNDTYIGNQWTACYDRAANEDINLLLFPGKGPNNPDTTDFPQTAAYRLLNPHLLDGAIVSQTVMTHMGSDRYQALIDDLPKIPMVTAAVKMGDLPACLIDNSLGIRQILRHLVEVHHCKRIAHIRGPKNNAEAEIREATWHEEMERAGLPHGPDLLLQGHFDPMYIDRIGPRLMERTKGNFDAVFACNDNTALILIDDFRRMGKQVPGDYAVVGFDDIRRCQFSSPALTTVSQAKEKMINLCWDSLTQLVENPESQPKDEILGTEPVIRASCGCRYGQWSPEAFSQLSQTTQKHTGQPSTNGNPHFYHEDNQQPSQELLSIMSYFDLVQVNILDKIYMLSNFQKSLTHCQEIDELPAILREWLPRLGYSYYALLQVCDQVGNPGEHHCTLDEGEFLPNPPAYFKYLTTLPPISDPKRVIPSNSLGMAEWTVQLPRHAIGAFPLVVGEEWYGLLFLKLERDGLIMSRIIQEQVAALLERDQRTKAFIRKGIEEQARTMVEAEKMKALTILVSGIAHEINTPLGISITSATYLANHIEKTQQKFTNGDLSKSDLENYLNESNEGITLLESNLQRATGLLRDFRKIAISEYTSEMQEFDLCEHIRMIVRSLKPAISAHSARIELLGPESLIINSWAFPFVEIVNNLIMNALQHAFTDQADRLVTISLEADRNQKTLTLKVRDNGNGIGENDRIHIFEPFFTTRRSEGGTGLGLYIVFNLVTQKLSGSIHCNTSKNEGTVFKLTFPAQVLSLKPTND